MLSAIVLTAWLPLRGVLPVPHLRTYVVHPDYLLQWTREYTNSKFITQRGIYHIRAVCKQQKKGNVLKSVWKGKDYNSVCVPPCVRRYDGPDREWEASPGMLPTGIRLLPVATMLSLTKPFSASNDIHG